MLETTLFWNFITILSTIVEWVVLKILLDEVSKLNTRKFQVNMGIILASTIILILTVVRFNINYKLFICILLTYTLYIKNYEVDKWKCLFISLLYWLLLIGFDSLALSIVGFINHIQDISKLLDNNFFRLELIIISKSLLILLIPLIKIIKLDISIPKKDYIYLNIPILTNIISIIVIFGYILNDKSIESKENIAMLIISLVILFSNISLVIIIRRIINDTQIKAEHEITKEKMNAQYKYYLNLKESQEKVKRLYHDMNNHIICIQEIYGKHEFTDKYINSINSQIKESITVFDTKSIILDIILHEKKSICNKNNIDFLVDINFSKCDFIEITDICSIFSNMIDNAIEACDKIKNENINKEIKLRGSIVNNFFVIKCENTKTNKVTLKNNKIITDKKDLFLHGIGIDSIKSSVKKYNGNVEIRTDKNKFTMIIIIPLVKIQTQLDT